MASRASLRIVDFSTHLPGPLASHILKELGATVVKVENPAHGDGNRGTPPFVDGTGMFHFALNSGTRSLAVDRHSELWSSVVAAAARWADAVIVGARPKDARRRGMDFDTLRAANPGIVYCALSGFGDHGPWRDNTAHGQTIDAFAGNVPVEAGELQPQTRYGFRTAGTPLGGVFAALGVLNAVLQRERGHSNAQYVSVSLWGAAIWWNWRDVAMLSNTGERWMDYSDLGSRYSMYATSDGRSVLVAPIEQRFWERFCDVLELGDRARSRGDWSRGSEYGEGPDYQDERRAIAARFAQQPLARWSEALRRVEIPFAPVLSLQEALGSEHARVNGVLRETSMDGHALRIPTVPVHTAGDDSTLPSPAPYAPPPGIGEHNDELLDELGVTRP
jgi:crotonobetainyl-CoA:carnitine CoA-transferase CaiB-like acyl-CoA transferase